MHCELLLEDSYFVYVSNYILNGKLFDTFLDGDNIFDIIKFFYISIKLINA